MGTTHRLGSTYRLQLNGLGSSKKRFAAATALVPFLHELGVETAYLSPIASAMPGSTHGYDVIDPTTVDPELGGRDGLEQLLEALAAHDMHALIDIVPNHVAAHPVNPFFNDLLRRGRRSSYADWFDVSWERADGRIVLPVLEGTIAEVIARGELRVDRDPGTGEFEFRLGSTRYPIADPDSDDLVIYTELSGVDPRQDRAVAREVELLVSHQHYRLVDWRTANQAVNYRRFFAINELIGIRQEDPEVFAATHTLVDELTRDDRIAGFRVDHVDGMRDPTGYLQMLRDLIDANGARQVIEVEKILARDEALPSWPVDGTTGYETGAAITGLMLDAAGVRAIEAEQATVAGDSRTFEARAVAAKYSALAQMFTGQLDQVTRALVSVGVTADPADVRVAVEALTANLEVYRTYRRDDEPMRREDIARVRAAGRTAREDLKPAALDALDKVVAVLTGPLGDSERGKRAVRGWQQLSSPVVAKGVEDTATFDAGTLLASCEVGADPATPAWSVDEWHRVMTARAADSPRSMNAGSTHDSKRSVDVRSRLAVLSEAGPEWTSLAGSLDALTADSPIGPAARRYLYQTLVGVWPLDGVVTDDLAERVRSHVVKAAREASVATSWTTPNDEYETAYGNLATELANGPGARLLAALADQIGPAGATNSLAAVALGATAPGSPDTYQGDDVWSFTLTDPDNRGPVDWAGHRALLSAEATPADLTRDWRSGQLKQQVLRRCLCRRRELGEWWDRADYLSIESTGAAASHVLAFARSADGQTVVTVVPRLAYSLAGPGAFPTGDVWTDTEITLPGDRAWRDVIADRNVDGATGGAVRVADLLGSLPVAVLVSY